MEGQPPQEQTGNATGGHSLARYAFIQDLRRFDRELQTHRFHHRNQSREARVATS